MAGAAEHIMVEDTADLDCGELLQAAHGQLLASPKRLDPFSNLKLFHGAVVA